MSWPWLWAGATYRLTPEECAIVEHEARFRQDRSKQSFMRYDNWSPLEPLQHECNSVGAEVALAVLTRGRWIPAKIDEPVEGRPDVVLPNGQTADAKSTHHPRGRLLQSARASGRADLYMLVIGVVPTYEFKGWATASELRRLENFTTFYGGPDYVLGQPCLHKCLELVGAP